METIIKKAIEGGYLEGLEIKEVSSLGVYGHTKSKNEWPINRSTAGIVLDPLFWQALGRACGTEVDTVCEKPWWKYVALRFHEINLTESWSAAVEYLRSVCGIEK